MRPDQIRVRVQRYLEMSERASREKGDVSIESVCDAIASDAERKKLRAAVIAMLDVHDQGWDLSMVDAVVVGLEDGKYEIVWKR